MKKIRLLILIVVYLFIFRRQLEDNADGFSIPSSTEYKDLIQNNKNAAAAEKTIEKLKLENCKLSNDKENFLSEV